MRKAIRDNENELLEKRRNFGCGLRRRDWCGSEMGREGWVFF